MQIRFIEIYTRRALAILSECGVDVTAPGCPASLYAGPVIDAEAGGRPTDADASARDMIRATVSQVGPDELTLSARADDEARIVALLGDLAYDVEVVFDDDAGDITADPARLRRRTAGQPGGDRVRARDGRTIPPGATMNCRGRQF